MRVDRLPNAYAQFLKANKISSPINQKGDIFRTMARLKLEHKFKLGFKKKMNEVVGVY